MITSQTIRAPYLVGQAGLSAYQLAVADGYNGTLSQWLLSLQGQQGAKGDPGTMSVSTLSVATLAAIVNSLPTASPSAPGELWNNGGLVAITLSDSSGAETMVPVAAPFLPVTDSNLVIPATARRVSFTALTAARTIQLPSAAAFPPDRTLVIGDGSGACSTTNTVTITAAGTDTIAGGTSVMIEGAYQSFIFYSDGSSIWTY